MFIGHYGVGLAAKKPAKSVSLGTLFLSAQWLDLLWPVLIVFNIEQVEINPHPINITPLDFVYYPFSHSLLFVLIWSTLFGGIYFIFKKNLRNALIVGLLVLSHWMLDLFVHVPDLPILPAGPYIGLGLWKYPAIETIIEIGIFITGAVIYAKCTSPKDKIGVYGFWSLIALLTLIHLANIFGPPPPDVKSLGYVSLFLWLFVPWAYWADKHRAVK